MQSKPVNKSERGQRPVSTRSLWSGRFAGGGGGSDPIFRAVNDSLPVDWRLVQQDIAGSVAWVRALNRAGVLTRQEADKLAAGLGRIADEAAGLDGPPIESGAEDVHTWVEQRLTEELGELGKKLHTGRSRNDQVVTDLRLWLKEATVGLMGLVGAVQSALTDQAHAHAGTAFPGYTHMQRAQPVTFGHWCLAYAEMLDRDASRLGSALGRMDECPLGCAALAGTAYPIDRHELAMDLGFARPSANSLDAISDRDPVLEVLGALSVLGVHLSRMAEDLVCYATGEFGLVECDDGVSSGSSIMPQKRNPDSLELIRGKAGRLIGAQMAMLALMKGLPLSYDKDLQEDKAILFGAVDEAELMLRLSERVVRGLRVNAAAAMAAAQGGYASATDLADEMVAAGVPFREAHERAAALVRAAMKEGQPLETVSEAAFTEHAPMLDGANVRERLTVARGLAKRAAFGGTAPGRVAEAAEAMSLRLAAAPHGPEGHGSGTGVGS